MKRSCRRPVEILQDKSERLRFRVRARNGRILASSQAYAGRSGARKGAEALLRVLQESGETGDMLQKEGEGCSRTSS